MWLVVNAGSSSVKLRVFDPALIEVAKAAVDRIGAADRRTTRRRWRWVWRRWV